MFTEKYSLYFAWLVSTIGVLVSLYFSEVLHAVPCHLCWCQRIALFPLPVILGIACYRGDLMIALYVLPQVVAGFLLSIYQIALQEIPGFNPIEICGAGPSCSEKIDIGLGPISIPMLAAFGFLLLIIFLSMALSKARMSDSGSFKKHNNDAKS